MARFNVEAQITFSKDPKLGMNGFDVIVHVADESGLPVSGLAKPNFALFDCSSGLGGCAWNATDRRRLTGSRYFVRRSVTYSTNLWLK